jgi:invasion protein IalB
MRVISSCLVVGIMAAAPSPLMAQQRPPAKPVAPSHPVPRASGPKAIGKFEDWTAATNLEAGQTVCYAFTRAAASSPAVPGRSDVVLTVTERATPRDAVAISAGFPYAPNASVAVNVESTTFDFYTAQRSAFARDGHAVVAALQKGSTMVAKSPTPKSGTVSDTFSLRGFSAAYAAIVKACPAK